MQQVLEAAGFTQIDGPNVRIKGVGLGAPYVVTDADGGRWVILIGGPFVRYRGGLNSTDAVWRTLGQAHALRGAGERVLVLTSDVPRRRTEFDQAIRAAGPDALHDVIDVFDGDALERLAAYAAGERRGARLLVTRQSHRARSTSSPSSPVARCSSMRARPRARSIA
ncbi:MAG: hypothetical protein R2697_13400 [Ilumatobacteraceae bacterium]